MSLPDYVLLVCTVGGRPAPIVYSIREWQPEKVFFVASPQTIGDVDSTIAPDAGLSPGRYECFQVEDSQDFRGCVEGIRKLSLPVETWTHKSARHRVVVDITGGTKSMSAALALVAHRWPACTFSYVGGKERDRAGVGDVKSGMEQVLYQANPWEALGYQAIEEYRLLFDQHAFVAAQQLAAKTKTRLAGRARKQQFEALEELAAALYFLDRFQHKRANDHLNQVRPNDLRAALDDQRAELVVKQVEELRNYVGQLVRAGRPSRELIVDLLANAKRRKDEHLYDDAVARLYRVIEAIGQLRIREYGFEASAKVPLDRLPPKLRDKWLTRTNNGEVKLALQDLYALLAEYNDPLAETFGNLNLNADKSSPLIARNTSILAHGFQQVTEKAFNQLWPAALTLAEGIGIRESDLPVFPKLNPGPAGGSASAH